MTDKQTTLVVCHSQELGLVDSRIFAMVRGKGGDTEVSHAEEVYRDVTE